MMKKTKHLLLTAAFIILAAVTIGAVGWTIKYFNFYGNLGTPNGSFVAATPEEAEVQELSEQLGIKLDPALEKHAALLDARDRLVIYQDALQFTRMEDGWYRGTVDCSQAVRSGQPLSEDSLYIYTGGYTDGGYITNYILISGEEREIAGVITPVFGLVVQLRPESSSFPSGDRSVIIRTGSYTNFAWQAAGAQTEVTDSDQAVYLYSDGAGAWFQKRIDSGVLNSQIPNLMLGTASGGLFGKTDLIQFWGNATNSDPIGKTERVSFELYMGEDWLLDGPCSDLSFWYPDSLNP